MTTAQTSETGIVQTTPPGRWLRPGVRQWARIVSVLLVVTVLLSGCDSSTDWSELDISNAAIVWVNETGLNQTDEDVWSDRLDEVCADDPDYSSLAEQYIAEDAEYSIRSDGDLPTIKKAQRSLYGIRLQTCGPQQ